MEQHTENRDFVGAHRNRKHIFISEVQMPGLIFFIWQLDCNSELLFSAHCRYEHISTYSRTASFYFYFFFWSFPVQITITLRQCRMAVHHFRSSHAFMFGKIHVLAAHISTSTAIHNELFILQKCTISTEKRKTHLSHVPHAVREMVANFSTIRQSNRAKRQTQGNSQDAGWNVVRPRNSCLTKWNANEVGNRGGGLVL